MTAIPQQIARVRQAFETGESKKETFRRSQLWALYKLIEENEQRLLDVLAKDLHKNVLESLVGEINMTKSEIAMHLKHLTEWMKPETPKLLEPIQKMDVVQIRPEPFGVALIIGAWNYPIQLTLIPLVGAISAGNAAVIKPSDLSVHTAALLAELIPKYLDNNFFTVVLGGPAETTILLQQKFDKILYTGSGSIGRIVLEAAAKFMTPVALELGGKSPCLVDKGVDLAIVARRITWGRLMNSGQTCISPDYVLCDATTRDALVVAIKKTIKEFYGDDPSKSPDLSRIINVRHFQRLKQLMESNGRIVVGGETDEKQRYIAPTVIVDVDKNAPILKEEIFGPLLPILTVRDMTEAVQYVNSQDKPLALYLFSNDKKLCEHVLTATSAGGVTVNDCLMHSTVAALPFGGVGASGMGAYHGKHTFDLWTHYKPIVIKKLGMEAVNSLRYPPYSRNKADWVSFIAYSDPRANAISKLFKLGSLIRASL